MQRFLLVPLLLAPAPVAADPALECNTGASSEVEIAACLAETEARVDTAVEAAFSFAMTSATDLDEMTGHETAMPALEAAQAAWSAYRDAQCDFAGASFGGGSGIDVVVRSCRIALGRARVEELFRYLQ